MREMAQGEIVHAVAVAPGIEHVGHQHRVVIGVDVDAAPGKDQPVVFQVLADLEDGHVLEHRLHRGERVRFRNLAVARLAGEQAAAVAALAMADRHIAGFIRRHGHGEAAQMRLHRIEAGGLGVDRHMAGLVGAGDPVLQSLQRADGFIAAVVDLLVTQFLRARDDQTCWTHATRAHAAGDGLAVRCAARAGRRRIGDRDLVRGELWVALDGARVDLTFLGDAARQR